MPLSKKLAAQFLARFGWCLADAERRCWMPRFRSLELDLREWRWRLG